MESRKLHKLGGCLTAVIHWDGLPA